MPAAGLRACRAGIGTVRPRRTVFSLPPRRGDEIEAARDTRGESQ
jgi:hypothetical protein